ncbi:MAG: aldehyde ferredoxin oxidoreductase, partial [Thaumarchaeota archaeon]
LKAIVVKGSGELSAANPDQLKELYKEANKEMLDSIDLNVWRKQGTMQWIEWSNEMCCLPTRNFQDVQFEAFRKIDGLTMVSKTRVHNKGCYLCPVNCGQVNRARGVEVEGPEYETAAMLGSNCAIESLEDIVYANYLCDQYGMDTISTGNVIAFAMECFEKGFLDQVDTGGLKLKFGNSDALLETIRKIAFREGLGNLLAEGVRAVSLKIGGGTERFAMEVKGLEMSGYDVRAAPAMALAYATADIGAHHNRAWALTYDIKTGRKNYGEEKVRWIIYLQHLRPLFDCLGVCRFTWVEFNLKPEYYAKFYSYATGLETSLETLLQRSERIWNLTRLISLRQGLKPGEDWLPARVFEDPIPSGPFKGLTLNREAFSIMLQQYYKFRGWNSKGIPSESKLKELGVLEAPKLSP